MTGRAQSARKRVRRKLRGMIPLNFPQTDAAFRWTRCCIATGRWWRTGQEIARQRCKLIVCGTERESAAAAATSPIVRLHLRNSTLTQLYSGPWATGLPTTPIRHPTADELMRLGSNAAVSWSPATIDRTRAADMQRRESATLSSSATEDDPVSTDNQRLAAFAMTGYSACAERNFAVTLRPSPDRPCGQSRRGRRSRGCSSHPPRTGRSPCRRR